MIINVFLFSLFFSFFNIILEYVRIRVGRGYRRYMFESL